MSTTRPEPLHIFYAFASQDEEYGLRLQRHLRGLKNLYHFTDWHHSHTPLGENIEQHTIENIDKADIILLLLSADFVDPNINGEQVRRIFERYERQEKVKIIPIQIKPIGVAGFPYEKLQMLPKNKQAITQWSNQEEAFVEIQKELHTVIKEIISSKQYTLNPVATTDDAQPSINHILETTENASVPTAQSGCIEKVFLQTYENRRITDKKIHRLNWKKYFIANEHLGGHQLQDPKQWSVLLKDLYSLRKKINSNNCIIELSGKHILSCAFAFGYVFSSVAGFVIEQNQGSERWRSDAPPNTSFQVHISSADGRPEGEGLDREGATIALGISANKDQKILDTQVRKYLDGRQEKVAALLLLQVEHEFSKNPLQNDSDATALANRVVAAATTFKQHWNAQKLLLFYIGPGAGATFIGQRLNAVCPKIQIMEYNKPEGVYIPTFLLT